jgi:long-chain acyl-CoA synthetase
MDASTASPKAAGILAGLPDRIGHVIRNSAREHPHRPALVDATTQWSYGELAAIVAELTIALRDFAIRSGDRMMIVSENSLQLAALVLAASEMNAWAVVVNPRLSNREIDQIREHSGARRVFYVGGVSPAAQNHAERHGAGMHQLGRLGAVGVRFLQADVDPEPVETDPARQVAVVLYTSGTTGNPKGVMLTHRNLLFNARVTGQLRRLSPEDRIYGVLPMSHIVGLSTVLVSALMFGAAIQVTPRYDPAELVHAVAEDGVSVLSGVPATYQRLLEYQALSGLKALPRGRLRYLGVAGAPLDLTLKTRIEAELGLPLLNAYGITECGPAISAVRSEAPVSDASVGRPFPGIELRLVGHDGTKVLPGEVGELHVRSPGVMRGYYRAPELTAAAIDANGWFNTGDLARLDGEKLYVVGRTKELIIRSGFNVYPPEVEGVLNAHPDVVQSAVVGRAVEGNEEVIAYVQLLPGAKADAAALMAHARAQLTAYKRPAEIVILDALPANSTGKILKHKLADAARDAVMS